MKNAQKTFVTLKNVKIQYPHLEKPFGFPGDEPKYSADFVIEGNDGQNKQNLWLAAVQAATLTFGDAEKAKAICTAKPPAKPGDQKYARPCSVVKATSRFPVQCLNQKNQPMTPAEIAEKIRGGAVVNVVLQLAGYNKSGNMGVTKYLTAVQLVKESDWTAGGNEKQDFSSFFQPLETEIDPF